MPTGSAASSPQTATGRPRARPPRRRAGSSAGSPDGAAGRATRPRGSRGRPRARTGSGRSCRSRRSRSRGARRSAESAAEGTSIITPSAGGRDRPARVATPLEVAAAPPELLERRDHRQQDPQVAARGREAERRQLVRRRSRGARGSSAGRAGRAPGSRPRAGAIPFSPPRSYVRTTTGWRRRGVEQLLVGRALLLDAGRARERPSGRGTPNGRGPTPSAWYRSRAGTSSGARGSRARRSRTPSRVTAARAVRARSRRLRSRLLARPHAGSGAAAPSRARVHGARVRRPRRSAGPGDTASQRPGDADDGRQAEGARDDRRVRRRPAALERDRADAPRDRAAPRPAGESSSATRIEPRGSSRGATPSLAGEVAARSPRATSSMSAARSRIALESARREPLAELRGGVGERPLDVDALAPDALDDRGRGRSRRARSGACASRIAASSDPDLRRRRRREWLRRLSARPARRAPETPLLAVELRGRRASGERRHAVEAHDDRASDGDAGRDRRGPEAWCMRIVIVNWNGASQSPSPITIPLTLPRRSCARPGPRRRRARPPRPRP